jgi:iron complex transport system ATP-binding protein
MLAGLEPPSSGQVRLGGQAMAAVAKAERARIIGYLPQAFAPHWDLTVGELMEIGAARVARLAIDALPRALTSFELAGLERRRWSTLSGGEQARALLAMVLVTDPPLLLADEPAASLDIRHRLDVVRRLARRGPDRLSVVVVHDLDLAFAYFDRILLIDRGRVMADASPAELIDDPVLDRVFGVRFERLVAADGISLRARTS